MAEHAGCSSSSTALVPPPGQSGWGEHFGWDGARLLAKTPAGRATIHLLQINRADAVAVRRLLMKEGVFHPDPTAN